MLLEIFFPPLHFLYEKWASLWGGAYEQEMSVQVILQRPKVSI